MSPSAEKYCQQLWRLQWLQQNAPISQDQELALMNELEALSHQLSEQELEELEQYLEEREVEKSSVAAEGGPFALGSKTQPRQEA